MGEVKKLREIVAVNLRQLVQAANEKNLKKDDIVFIDNSKGQYTLIYFG